MVCPGRGLPSSSQKRAYLIYMRPVRSQTGLSSFFRPVSCKRKRRNVWRNVWRPIRTHAVLSSHVNTGPCLKKSTPDRRLSNSRPSGPCFKMSIHTFFIPPHFFFQTKSGQRDSSPGLTLLGSGLRKRSHFRKISKLSRWETGNRQKTIESTTSAIICKLVHVKLRS